MFETHDEELVQRVRSEHERLATIKADLTRALDSDAEIDPHRWLAAVLKNFEHFRAHLIHRFALEEVGGFLNVVVERRPTLTHQVNELRNNHQALIELVGQTMGQLRELPKSSESAQHAELLVRMVISRIKYHEESEQLLVSYVFTQEIGVGD